MPPEKQEKQAPARDERDLSEEQLNDLEALIARATPPPWSAQRLDANTYDEMVSYLDGTIRKGGARYFLVAGSHVDGGPADVCHTGNGRRSEANAHLVAQARDALPSLIAEVRRSRAALRAARSELSIYERTDTGERISSVTEAIREVDAALRAAPTPTPAEQGKALGKDEGALLRFRPMVAHLGSKDDLAAFDAITSTSAEPAAARADAVREARRLALNEAADVCCSLMQSGSYDDDRESDGISKCADAIRALAASPEGTPTDG